MSDLEPITRKEQYLNRLTGEEQAIPETPVTRTEQYLARLCGMETEIPSSPITREEAYLAYLNGEDVTLPEPITRLEQFMAFAAEKSETKPTPLTREEFYWDKYQGGAVLKDFPDLPASIVTVTDALAKPLDSLKVAITPVQSGSGDPSPDNIRPISGWDAVGIVCAGENILPAELQFSIVGNFSTGGSVIRVTTITSASNARVTAVPIPKNTEITIQKSTSDASDCAIGFGYTNDIHVGSYVYNTYGLTNIKNISVITGEFGWLYVKSNTLINLMALFTTRGFMISIGSSRKKYKGGIETTETITLHDSSDNPITVYGGTLDVVNGTLTVTKANIASYDGETLPSAWISDRDVYAEGTTPTTGAQVVYDLDTPITYQLTPTEVQMLLGTNNIWADTGDILEGKYWGKK